jgi:hypothetical protein
MSELEKNPTSNQDGVSGISSIKPDGRIYFAVHTYSIMVLIPKKRGVGFLRQPVGHHANDLSRFIDQLGYDCCGLDGYLDINTGFTHNKDFTELKNKISKFFGKEVVEVNSDAILNWHLQ